MNCPDCGNELVQVDNPMRFEVRHKRGQECEPKRMVEHEHRFNQQRVIDYENDCIIYYCRCGETTRTERGSFRRL